jgi:hypothetical protein
VTGFGANPETGPEENPLIVVPGLVLVVWEKTVNVLARKTPNANVLTRFSFMLSSSFLSLKTSAFRFDCQSGSSAERAKFLSECPAACSKLFP